MPERWKDLADTVIENDRDRSAMGPARRAVDRLLWGALDLGLRVPRGGRYLLMLCPARSGSSMTLHVLNSNPAISSRGESHVSYHDASDLRLLLLRTNVTLRTFRVRDRYTLDKLVFDYHVVSDEVCANPDVRFLFLLREPRSNLASLLSAFPDVTEASVDRYYTARVAEMVRYARLVDDPERAYFFTYEHLTSPGVDDVLAHLQQWLGVADPFSTDYRLIPGHGYGRWGRGDYSENLAQGRILDVSGSGERAEVDSEIFASSLLAYRRATSELIEATTTPPVDDVIWLDPPAGPEREGPTPTEQTTLPDASSSSP